MSPSSSLPSLSPPPLSSLTSSLCPLQHASSSSSPPPSSLLPSTSKPLSLSLLSPSKSAGTGCARGLFLAARCGRGALAVPPPLPPLFFLPIGRFFLRTGALGLDLEDRFLLGWAGEPLPLRFLDAVGLTAALPLPASLAGAGTDAGTGSDAEVGTGTGTVSGAGAGAVAGEVVDGKAPSDRSSGIPSSFASALPSLT